MAMTKTILILAIAAAFVVGTLTTGPVVEAAGGWKAAVDALQTQIDNIELIPGPQGDPGPAVLPTTVHLQATGSLTGPPFTIPGLETSITVGSTNQIYISATTESDNTGLTPRQAGIALFIDSTEVQISPLSTVVPSGNTTNTVHWSGSLSAGAHSISVSNTQSGSYCKEFGFDKCHMDILIFE